ANNNGGDFLTYTAAGGISNTTYVSNFGAATAVVSNGSVLNLTSAQQAYALKLQTNLNLNGNNLTLGDGVTAGLIFGSNGRAITNGGAAASLNLGAAEGVVYIASGNTGTIGVNVSGTGGLTEFGGGSLVLTNITSLYSGDTTIDGGTLTVAAA